MVCNPFALITLLICMTQYHIGIRGDTPTVTSEVGQNVILSCANVVKADCSTTTWIYSGGRPQVTIEVVKLGKVRSHECADKSQVDECKRFQRLSLCCGCSLYITNVTSEDAGYYACQQYQKEGGDKIAPDASVDLSVQQGDEIKFPPTPKSPKTTGISGVPLFGVIAIVFVASLLILIVVICKRRTKAGNEPKHTSAVGPKDDRRRKEDDMHYAAFQQLNPYQVEFTSMTH